MKAEKPGIITTADFIPTQPLKTAVAFLVFNRPDTTARVFEEIRRARPPKLLVVADGPRPALPGEAEKCAATRAIIEQVDWPCEVLKNYTDINLGCKRRVSSGLDWVFETVPEAIILEDDCLPHPSFFRFCEELLEKYRYDERLMMISGCNVLNIFQKNENSYFYSKYPHIWGWASWRRVWKYYDVDIINWPKISDSKGYLTFSSNTAECLYWKRWFDIVNQGKIDTWDAQVTFMCFLQDGLSIFPNRNLISNIGFNKEGTHTNQKDPILSNLKTFRMDFPLNHPSSVVRDIEKDETRRTIEYVLPSLGRKIINTLVSSILFKSKGV